MPKVLSEKERKQKEEVILENAMEMFDASSFSEITMNALAKKCDMAKGTLFNYFPTKETLFSRLMYREYAGWAAHELKEIEKHEEKLRHQFTN